MFSRITTAGVLVTTLFASAAAGADPLLELDLGGNAYVGKSLAHDEESCWLMEQDGCVYKIPLDQVTSYRKVSNEFCPMSSSALRSRLREELGPDYDVTILGKFVVAAPDGKAHPYADLLDDVYRGFVRFFSRRSFRLADPEVPLVAVVYADVSEFAEQCRRDGVSYSATLRGYYHPASNRVVLYESSAEVAGHEMLDAEGLSLSSPQRDRGRAGAGYAANRAANIQADLRDTLVHEATHQLAFNMGLNSRISENPVWVVEGLALIFERQLSVSPEDTQRGDLNEARYAWFTTRVRPNWSPGTLKQFVGSDEMFSSQTLDAYSLAWALTYYLSDRRSADFARYLQTIREHDVSTYPEEARLADFQQCFGNDIDWLEVQLLRYIDGLE